METLALIESIDRDLHVRQLLRVTQWPVSIGRAITCDLVLDDPHLAAHHADLVWHDGAVCVAPAASINGVQLGLAKVAPGSAPPLPRSGMVSMGTTLLRVRLASDELLPEAPLLDTRPHERRRAAVLMALILFAALWKGFELWLNTMPGAQGSQLAWGYLSAPLGLVVWCSAWAIGSMLFQRRFAFWAHLHVALMWLLVAIVAQAVTGQLAFALSMPSIEKLGRIAFVGAIAMMMWQHMGLLLPTRRRAFAIAIASAVTVGGGLLMIDRSMQQEPLVGDLYLGTISLPSVRVAGTVSADAFVKSAAPLKDTLSKWAKPGDDDDDAPASDED